MNQTFNINFPDSKSKALLSRFFSYFQATEKQFIKIQTKNYEIYYNFGLLPYKDYNFDALNDFFTDIHLFFVCWDQCRKVLNSLKNSIKEQWLTDFYNKYKSTIEKYKWIRNQMEHWDEKVLDGISDLGNYNSENNTFSFNGKKFSIDINCMKALHEMFNDFLKTAYLNLNKQSKL